MEPSPLTLEEKLIFRNVRKAAIVWLLLIRLDPQPVNETLAAETLAIDKETARKYLRTLHECEIITKNKGRYTGYTLTDGGRQLTLPIQLAKLQTGNAEIPRSQDEQNAGIIDILDYSSSGSAEIPRSSAEFPRSRSPLKKEEEEELYKKNIKSSSSSLEKETIIEKAAEILKSPIVTEGIDLEINTIENILGWIAEAYDRRDKLRNPASLVYSRLKAGTPARNRYKIEPGKYLPAEYMSAIERTELIPPCIFCQEYPCECPEEDDDEWEDPEWEAPNPRIGQKWNQSSMLPEKAWQAALGQMQMEMPKAAFDTWVKNLVLLDADPDKTRFTIGAYNDYQVEWIQDRLKSQIKKLLTGIMNASLEIEIRKIDVIKSSDKDQNVPS